MKPGLLRGIRISFYLSLLVLMACKDYERSYQVMIIVPEDYIGPIRMVFDEEDGLPIERTDNYRVFRVSEDGVVVSRAENPFLKWGEGLVVRDENGRIVPVAIPDSEMAPDRIMFRPVGGPPDGSEFWAAIGTEEEYLDAGWGFRNPGTKRPD